MEVDTIEQFAFCGIAKIEQNYLQFQLSIRIPRFLWRIIYNSLQVSTTVDVKQKK